MNNLYIDRFNFIKGKNNKFKKIYKALILFIILVVCLFPYKNLTALSDNYNDELNKNILDQLNELDLKELEDYVNSLGFSDNKTLLDRLIDYIKGGDFEYNDFQNKISDIFFKDVKKLAPSLICIIAISLLCNIVSSIKNSGVSNSISKIIYLAGYMSTLIAVLPILILCFSKTKKSINMMTKQMQIIYPILLTLMSTGGGSVSAAIFKPAVSFFSNVIIYMISSIVLPITIIIIAFSICGNIVDELKLNRFTSFFKSINKWIIGINVSIFGLFFTVQGLTSATYDGITRRAAKYAIGTGIPIVGGFLSGGFDLAVAGSILIKNSLGNFSIFIMIWILLEPIILLVAVNLFLRLSAALTQLFYENRITSFLTETADNMNYCTASLIFVGFLYFISIILIICSSEVLF